MTLLVHSEHGGYDSTRGWYESFSERVDPIEPKDMTPPEAIEDDHLSTHEQKRWVTLDQHSRDVWEEASAILDALDGLALDEWQRGPW